MSLHKFCCRFRPHHPFSKNREPLERWGADPGFLLSDLEAEIAASCNLLLGQTIKHPESGPPALMVRSRFSDPTDLVIKLVPSQSFISSLTSWP